MSPFAVGKGLFATINSFKPHNSLSGPRAGLHLLGEQRLSSGLHMRASEASDTVNGEEAPTPAPLVSQTWPFGRKRVPPNS